MKNNIIKLLLLIFTSFFIMYCTTKKKEEVEKSIIELNQESLSIDSTYSKEEVKNLEISIETNKNEIKIAPIKNIIDDSESINDYLIHKEFLKETETYTVAFCYPYLNEKENSKFENFNNYIENKLLKLPEIEQNIIEAQELLCDTSAVKPYREYRLADYKVFLKNEKHLSILFYMENHYTHTKATYYTFETINFDMEEGSLLNYDDYFNPGTIEEVLKVVNAEIVLSINNGDKYYECFEVSLEDFKAAKNDFIIKDDKIIFYFNDCVMCPSYLGTHEVEVVYEKLRPLLKKYKLDIE